MLQQLLKRFLTGLGFQQFQPVPFQQSFESDEVGLEVIDEEEFDGYGAIHVRQPGRGNSKLPQFLQSARRWRTDKPPRRLWA